MARGGRWFRRAFFHAWKRSGKRCCWRRHCSQEGAKMGSKGSKRRSGGCPEGPRGPQGASGRASREGYVGSEGGLTGEKRPDVLFLFLDFLLRGAVCPSFYLLLIVFGERPLVDLVFGRWVLRAKIGICEGFCKAPHEYKIACLALWNLSQRILMQFY